MTYTVESLAQQHGFERVSGEWKGANPTGCGPATKDGFILNDDGTSMERGYGRRNSKETAIAFGIDPMDYEPYRNFMAGKPSRPSTKKSVTAAPSKSLPLSQSKRPTMKGEVAGIFVYHDESGNPYCRKVREDLPSGGKTYYWERFEGSKWVKGLGKVAAGLYNLPDVRKATHVILPEGEKCVDAINERLKESGVYGDWVAASGPNGSSNWPDALSSALEGKHAIILPDNDEVGRKYAEKVKEALLSTCSSVKGVALPNLPEKGDVVDYFESGKHIAELLEFLTFEQPKYVTDEALDAVLADVTYLWPGWIPNGFVTVLCGAADGGKSTVALDLCRCLLTGSPWPDRQENIIDPRGQMLLWIDTESSQAIFRQRLIGFNMPRGRFVFPPNPLHDIRLDNASDWAWIIGAIDKFKPPLVVIDSFSGAHGGEENSNDAMKAIMKQVSNLARDKNIAILVIHHLSKPAPGIPDWPVTMNMLRGASAVSQFARSILGLGLPNKEEPMARALMHVKHNLGMKAETIGYVLTDDGPAWGDAPQPPKKHYAVDDALDFLRTRLKGGMAYSDEVDAEARAKSIGANAIKDAKKILGITARREGGRNGRWVMIWDSRPPQPEAQKEGQGENERDEPGP